MKQKQKQKTDLVADAIAQAKSLVNQKKLPAALALLSRVQKKNKRHPELNFQLSQLLSSVRNFDLSARHADMALSAFGDHAASAVFLHRATLYLQTKAPEKALELSKKGLDRHPNSPHLHLVAGRAMRALGNNSAAISLFENAVNLEPKNSQSLQDLAQALEASGQFKRALIVFRYCRNGSNPPNNSAMLIANLLQQMDRYDESLAYYQVALKEMGHQSFLYLNLGALLRRSGAPEKAFHSYKKSAVLKPNDGGCFYNLGNLDRAGLDAERAAKWFRQAIAVEPQNGTFHWNYALVKLLEGDLDVGFSEYEWRWQHAGFPSRRRNFKQPQWDGKDYSGKTLFVHAEQGMGDHFQFMRFIPEIARLKGNGGKLILECHDGLMTLFANYPDVDQVIERNVDDPSTLPAFDVHLPIVSAPFALDVKSFDDMPTKAPYLSVSDGPDLVLPNADPKALKIGFVWGGNPDFSDDKKRSTDLDYYQPLFDIPGTQFFCLQKGPREPEINAAPQKVVRLNDQIDDFRDTAVYMNQLDLVITTCTSVAHLAGGLGRPTWVLLHTNSDWRWLLDTEDSPWYPTARLFRQPTNGDWQGVFDTVSAALLEAVRAHQK
jgi:tetratricopeptide (TPR) repeat protein